MAGSFAFSFGLAEIFYPDETAPLTQEDVESLLNVRDREVEDFLTSGSGAGTFKAALVATSESTGSTSFTALATAGPAVTLRTGTTAIVTVGTLLDAGAGGRMGVAVSGATTLAASNACSVWANMGVADLAQVSFTFYLTGLAAGSNTFTAQYKVDSGTGSFSNRNLVVQAL